MRNNLQIISSIRTLTEPICRVTFTKKTFRNDALEIKFQPHLAKIGLRSTNIQLIGIKMHNHLCCLNGIRIDLNK